MSKIENNIIDDTSISLTRFILQAQSVKGIQFKDQKVNFEFSIRTC